MRIHQGKHNNSLLKTITKNNSNFQNTPLESDNHRMIHEILFIEYIHPGAGGGGGALTPHFGRYMYVPRQSEKWEAPELAQA